VHRGAVSEVVLVAVELAGGPRADDPGAGVGRPPLANGVDEDDLDAGADEVESDTGTGDAAADHDHAHDPTMAPLPRYPRGE
jgi:hypothetical protein